MPFISTTAHQKFVSQCDRFIESSENTQVDIKDSNVESLLEDLTKLQQLAESYLDKLSQLSEITNEYNTLQRRIRGNIRRLRL